MEDFRLLSWLFLAAEENELLEWHLKKKKHTALSDQVN